MDVKGGRLDQCVINLQQHENVLCTLQIITDILDTFPDDADDFDDSGHQPTKSAVINDLLKNSKILSHLLNDIDDLKQNKDEYYLNQMTPRIEFLTYLISNVDIQTVLNVDIRAQEVESIWELCIGYDGISNEEKELIIQFLLKLIEQCDTTEDKRNIFYMRILSYFNNIKNIKYMRMNGFKCFRDCFLTVNHSQKMLSRHLKSYHCTILDYDNIIGMDLLWNIIIYCQDSSVTRTATYFHVRLTENICNKNKRKSAREDILKRAMNLFTDTNSNDCIKSILLEFLNNLLNQTEKYGLKGLKPHKALILGNPLFSIKIIDRINFSGFGRASEFYIDDMYEYNTLWDLKVKISCKTSYFGRNVSPDRIIIYLRTTTLNVLHVNSLTLSECGIKNGCTIHCVRDQMRSMRVPLLTEQNPPKLVQKCVTALKNIWDQYAKENNNTMMNIENMRTYIFACGAGENSASVTRVSDIFSTHNQGSNDKNVFAFEGFCSFYRQACIERPEHVWNDLVVHGFEYDLSHKDNAFKDEENAYELLCSWLISNNDEWFNILYDNCLQKSDNNEIIQLTSNLIFRLPTNMTIKDKIFNNLDDWNRIVSSNNINIMLYAAFLWESVIFDSDNSELIELFLVNRKGFDFLIKLLFLLHCDMCIRDLSYSEFKPDGIIIKRILRMIHSFFRNDIAFDSVMPNIRDLFGFFEENEIIEHGMDENKNNFMHLVCLSSKYNQIEFMSQDNVKFYINHMLPANILNVYVEPLVFGYVKECKLSTSVSMDILRILLAFFF
eukprot:302946_1